ncbi:MAG: hypothetical protein INQ03_07850 [Candidatus Heimdallarchaeota archaeon]|nr:hypothetical protein [Candidatus Heimdallarchaeota archaeon]
MLSLNSKIKLLDRISDYRNELSTLIFNEQFPTLGSSSKSKTKLKLLDEILFLRNQINLLTDLHKGLEPRSFDHSSSTVVILDRSGVVTRMNRSNSVSPTYMIGRRFMDLMFNDLQVEMMLILSEFMKLPTNCAYLIGISLERDTETVQLEFIISPGPDDGLILSWRRIAQNLINTHVIKEFITICAYCRKVKASKDNWESIKQLQTSRVRVTHGMCPDCFEEMMSKIENEALKP